MPGCGQLAVLDHAGCLHGWPWDSGNMLPCRCRVRPAAHVGPSVRLPTGLHAAGGHRPPHHCLWPHAGPVSPAEVQGGGALLRHRADLLGGGGVRVHRQHAVRVQQLCWRDGRGLHHARRPRGLRGATHRVCGLCDGSAGAVVSGPGRQAWGGARAGDDWHGRPIRLRCCLHAARPIRDLVGPHSEHATENRPERSRARRQCHQSGGDHLYRLQPVPWWSNGEGTATRLNTEGDCLLHCPSSDRLCSHPHRWCRGCKRSQAVLHCTPC
mmetsp:Transcript_36605/g.65478  ORF Transcript_36605/g.65478 Transcript_36605/m.65478 type:complete len:268 (-) Transcript_36605:484-1287(-)